MACLDTDVLLDLLGRGGRGGVLRASKLTRRLVDTGHSLCTTCFNVAELLVGVYRARDPDAERAKLHTVLEGLRVLEFDIECVEVFGAIQAGLLGRGRPAGDMDVLIAAVSIRHQEKLVTGNVKHFREIPQLDLETYPHGV